MVYKREQMNKKLAKYSTWQWSLSIVMHPSSQVNNRFCLTKTHTQTQTTTRRGRTHVCRSEGACQTILCMWHSRAAKTRHMGTSIAKTWNDRQRRGLGDATAGRHFDR